MQKPVVSDADACIIQISDCHLLATPGERLHGWDNWAALEAVVTDVRRVHPNPSAILLTGDLVHDESAAGYQHLQDLMLKFGVPVYAIPGNHDSPATMAEAMPGIQVGGTAQIGTWQILMLDSHVDGSDSGRVGEQQIEQLHASLSANPQPSLVAVHHPPASVGSKWIDALGMADGGQLLKMLAQHEHVKAVICGHVHQACEFSTKGVQILTTPATTRQFLPSSKSPAFDTQKAPGYRCLHLSISGVLASQVNRVPQARIAGIGSEH